MRLHDHEHPDGRSFGDRGAQPHAAILVVQPDVQLSVLTAAGLQEARADWSKQGRDGLTAEIASALQARDHPVQPLDPGAAEGRPAQLLRLHDAVGRSIQAFSYGYVKLPSKRGPFDWTLGEGARALQPSEDVRYALFVTARGSYASAGRKTAMVAAALIGVSMPLGSQVVFASLVDLKTGQIVWFNVATAGPSADMRKPEGAHALATALMKGAPL